MFKAFIIITLAGLVVLGAGYLYGSLQTAATLRTVHNMHTYEEDRSTRNPGKLVMWLGGGLMMVGGAGLIHVFLKESEDETPISKPSR